MFKKLCVKTGLVAVLLSSFLFTTCQSLSSLFREPLLSLNSVELIDLNFTGVDLLCKVNVENPNAIEIPFPEVGWELFINTNSFVRGVIRNDQNIRARGTTVVNVPVSFNYLDVFNTFASLKGSKEINYKIDLAVKFALPILGDKVWNFSHEGTIPVLQMPSVSFKGVSLKNLSLTKIDFELVWEVENNNNFAMSVKDFSYDFTVNNSRWSSGKVSGSPQLGAGRKTQIPLTISISGLSMIRDITEIITRGTEITFGCGGNISFGAALPGLRDFEYPFDFKGTTRLRN